MVWVERDFKDQWDLKNHQIPVPLPWAKTPYLDQIAQIPIQPGLLQKITCYHSL